MNTSVFSQPNTWGACLIVYNFAYVIVGDFHLLVRYII